MKTKRILLVDDNESFCRPLSKILQGVGYEIQSANDGFAALKLFRQLPFDLVITDIVMPGKEGLETIMELRRLQPGILIIAISGDGSIDPVSYLLMAQRLGAVATLEKPFSAQQILELIASLLGEVKV